MKKNFIVVGAVIAAAGAVTAMMMRPIKSPPAEPPAPTVIVSPLLIETPVRFKAKQRSTVPLPGSAGRMTITVDDITRGQVLTTLSWADGRPIMATRSLRQGETVSFTVDTYRFTLTVLALKNVLVGTDSLEFELAPAAPSARQDLSEDDRIEMLIQSLAKLENATFIRNGEEHSVAEAVEHMRRKWDWKKKEIKTVEDFIAIVGSKSSVSGKPYLIKLGEEQTIKAEDWIREQLAQQDAAP